MANPPKTLISKTKPLSKADQSLTQLLNELQYFKDADYNQCF